MNSWDVQLQYTALLISAVFIIGLVFFVGVSAMVWRSKEGLSDRYVKLTVIIIVVTVAVSISVSGFAEQNVNSVLGLIGTIVGYLLGRTDSKNVTGSNINDAIN